MEVDLIVITMTSTLKYQYKALRYKEELLVLRPSLNDGSPIPLLCHTIPCTPHLLSEWMSLSRVALALDGRRGNSSLTMYCVSISSWHLNWQNCWYR